MFTALETIKSEIFAEKNSPIEKAQLNGHDPIFNEKKTKRKLSITEEDKQTQELTPKKMKLEAEPVNYNSRSVPVVSAKKGKSRFSKSSGLEDMKAKKEEVLKHLQRFVDVTMRYSEYLAKKIGTEVPKVSGILRNDDCVGPPQDFQKITKTLNYFEGGSLRPYQLEGVMWLTVLFENAINGILADEMGLGKTIQIIALFCHLYERRVTGPFLIVAPMSTLGNWETEFKKFAPKIPVVRFQGSFNERQEQIRQIKQNFFIDGRVVKPVVICSYQVPLYEEAFLNQFTWQYVVIDEGHRIKNSESKLSRELRALKSANRTLLTGTPLQNNIRELWALFNFLMPEIFQDIAGFSSLIELDDVKDKDKILENEAETKVISTIHKVLGPFILRREKKFVLHDMVPKRELIIYCPLSDLQKYLYRIILQKDMDKLLMRNTEVRETKTKVKRKCSLRRVSYSEIDMEENYETSAKSREKNNFVTKEHVPVDCPDCKYLINLTMQNISQMLKKAVNHPYLIWTPLDPNTTNRHLYISEDLVKHSGKLLVLDALLSKLKAQGHKVLIFSTLVMFMDLIEEFLMLRRYNYRKLHGGDNYDSRTASINDFQTDPNVFVFLLSTRAGGLGLNLTAADTIIFMDRDWNPMADVQAQDRCHRIGQTKPVMIYSLIVKNTVDEAIVMRGDMKRRLEKIVIKEGKFKSLTRNLDDTKIKELEDMLNNEEKLTKIHANGLLYTDAELDQILDRSELIQEMHNNAK